MLTLIRRPIGPGGRRRGVTLVEMLVVVALVVLMMVILVQIFQSATGAMSASRTIQELDVNLRQIDSVIRSDLAGVTAKMTPGMNDPKDKRGYFEYGENAFADAQGEDTDDWMAFTTRAPEGQVFSGRQWLGYPANQAIQPITINSQVAEVIYFLRNGNLYRRVFLVAPERAKTLTLGNAGLLNYTTPVFGLNPVTGLSTIVSWLGMNDISCRPATLNGTTNVGLPQPNDLGDLTNRENRAFRPRFLNDFTGSSITGGGDGIPDDNNGDDVNDYYPTLYSDGTGGHFGTSAPNSFVRDANGDPGRVTSPLNSYNIFAFPFIYPGMYSVPDPTRINTALGWIHYLQPGTDSNGNVVNNHSPLDLGDNLVSPKGNQVWWGFPTWRETMTGTSSGGVGWTDPINFLTRAGNVQPLGLQPFDPTVIPGLNNSNLLPPAYLAGTSILPPFANNAGSNTFIAIPSVTTPVVPTRVWDDDLLLTGVRSFDIKAYDQNAPLYNTTINGYFSAGYQDLGYGAASFVAGLPGLDSGTIYNFQTYGNEPQGFGHEGRIPPNFNDFRMHPRRPTYIDVNGNTQRYNIGDNATGIIRLNRTFDTWSTDYINAPDTDIFLNGMSNNVVPPYSNFTSLYPSFPPPYPSPLRGIQIQIRLVDARGEKAKTQTNRLDNT